MTNYAEAQPEQVESFISPASRYGLLRAASPDRTVWLYAKIPWAPALTDGATDERRLNSARQMMAFFDGLAGLVTVAGLKYRYLLRGQYRNFHILAGAVPAPYRSANPRGSDLERWQNQAYSNVHVQRQFAVVGVPLMTGIDDGTTKKPRPLERALTWLDRTAYSMANGFPEFEEYLPDMQRIEKIMLNAGLQPFSLLDEMERNEIVGMMKSWWVSSNGYGALGMLPENDHLHFFPNVDKTKQGEHNYEEGIPCKDWDIKGEYPATICFAKSSSFSGNRIADSNNLWIAKLLEVPEAGGANAVGVSIRGVVEPGVVTADQIRRNTRAIDEAMKERYSKGREASGDMEDIREKLEYKRSIYRHENMPPTLMDLSVAVCAAGRARQAVESLSCIPGMEFVNMNTSIEQYLAFKSMQPCSPVRMTPYELQWSATMVAGGGLSSMAEAGDKTGALLGFTEANQQPVYLGTTTAQDNDLVPIIAIVGKSGSGKTMALLSLLLQWAQVDSRDGSGKTPCILIDPKEDSDFSDAFHARGGQVYSMDSDIANGTFDPLNVLPTAEEAKEMAAIMLANILAPGGADAALEINITALLNYGIKLGAKTCGVAIETAYQAYMRARQNNQQIDLPENTPEVREQVMRLLNNNQFVRIICGTTQDVKPLKVSHSLTLIKAGKRSLVPAEGSEDTVTGRIQRWVLRMTVLGAGAAVRGRDGIVALDEAWVALGKGSGEVVSQWARLARSQRFTPVLASQKVNEFNDAGLSGAISRGILLANDDPDESTGSVSQAKAALRLLSIEDSDGHIRRRMALDPSKDNGSPEWNSLQRLKNPRNGRTMRGAVAYFKDGSKNPVRVEIGIPEKLLKEISTTATDVLARQRQKEGA